MKLQLSENQIETLIEISEKRMKVHESAKKNFDPNTEFGATRIERRQAEIDHLHQTIAVLKSQL